MSTMHQTRRSVSPSPILSILGVLLTLSIGLSCAPVESEVAEGTQAPPFQLPTLGGELLGTPDYPEKVVLLDFWATWCVPCHAQAEIIKPLYAEYKDQGFEVLSIDVEEDADDVRSFVEENPFPYPVLLDEAGKVSGQFAVMGLPTVVLLDREGQIIFARTGVVGAAQLRQLIEGALGQTG
jgi:thiol-disulfide isomerase/thioredoxin